MNKDGPGPSPGPALDRLPLSRRSLLRRGGLAAIAAGGVGSLGRGFAEDRVTVFAASSLADVMAAVAARPGRTGPTLRLSFAASSTLARQIEQGATADLFISADEAWMDYLQQRNRIVGESRRVLAANRLVVVRGGEPGEGEPPESAAALRAALASTAGSDVTRIATGDPAHVPVGRYAQAALTQLGLWTEVEPRLVRADNVRSALAFVERGEAAAGIVYATDVLLSKRIRVAARFPEASHPPIRYPVALVAGAAPAARAVWAELFTPDVRGLFRAAGFGAA